MAVEAIEQPRCACGEPMTQYASFGPPAWFCLNCDGTFSYQKDERVARNPTRRDSAFERTWRRRMREMYPALPRDVDMTDFEDAWYIPKEWLPREP